MTSRKISQLFPRAWINLTCHVTWRSPLNRVSGRNLKDSNHLWMKIAFSRKWETERRLSQKLSLEIEKSHQSRPESEIAYFRFENHSSSKQHFSAPLFFFLIRRRAISTLSWLSRTGTSRTFFEPAQFHTRDSADESFLTGNSWMRGKEMSFHQHLARNVLRVSFGMLLEAAHFEMDYYVIPRIPFGDINVT